MIYIFLALALLIITSIIFEIARVMFYLIFLPYFLVRALFSRKDKA